jgi:alpha-ketoglutarate-dependent taurine dioxygenase
MSADEHITALEPALRPTAYVCDPPGGSLAQFAIEHHDAIDTALRRDGAVRFLGFRVTGIPDFKDALDVLIPQKTPYVEAATPRKDLGHDVFTSTEFPASEQIALHNENSYAHTWPGRLLFGCLTAPASGGATPLADVRRVLARLSPATVETFTAKGWMLTRVYGTGFGLPWQTAFRTNSKDDVGLYCEAADVEYEWLEGDRLRTRQVRPAIARHPETSEPVWFNHVCFWHSSTYDPEIREMMTEEFGEKGLPYNTWYGDGQPIPDEVIEEIRRAYRAESISWPWQPGDAVLLDNMLVAHGREPYTGERRVVVSMGVPTDWTTCTP